MASKKDQNKLILLPVFDEMENRSDHHILLSVDQGSILRIVFLKYCAQLYSPPSFDCDQPALSLIRAQHLELEPDTQGDILDVYFRSSQRRASDRILFRHIYRVKEHFDPKDRGAM